MMKNKFNPFSYAIHGISFSNQVLYELVSSGRITILFACESGSRTWGFASNNSDYDVRFVYASRPEWYLSLNSRRDVIEVGDTLNGFDIDIVGWDISKFLSLVRSGNAMPFEWMFRSDMYYTETAWMEEAKRVAMMYFNPLTMAYHYRGMATKHWHRYILGREIVTHKKYLYIMRALIYMRHYRNVAIDISGGFEVDGDLFAPAKLIDAIPSAGLPQNVENELRLMIEKKINGDELGIAEPNRVLDEYIKRVVEYWHSGFGVDYPQAQNWDPLNRFFRMTIGA